MRGLKPAEQAALLEQFQHLCDTGTLSGEKLRKFRTKKQVAWEFRSRRWRIGTFQHGKQWVLTHGFVKKKQKTPKGEIEMIERIREEHLNRIEQRG